MNKKSKNKIVINKFEKVDTISPFQIYNINTDINVIITRPHKIIDYNKEVVHRGNITVDIRAFEILDNFLLALNGEFLMKESYLMPYDLGSKPYEVYRKNSMNNYVDFQELFSILANKYKDFQLKDSTIIYFNNSIQKRHENKTIFMPRVIEIFTK